MVRLPVGAGYNPKGAGIPVQWLQVDRELYRLELGRTDVRMPTSVPDVVVAIGANPDYVLAQKLFGRVGEARVVGQRRDERSIRIVQGRPEPLFSVVPSALDPRIQSGVKLPAEGVDLGRREQLAKNQKTKGAEVVQLPFTKSQFEVSLSTLSIDSTI